MPAEVEGGLGKSCEMLPSFGQVVASGFDLPDMGWRPLELEGFELLGRLSDLISELLDLGRVDGGYGL